MLPPPEPEKDFEVWEENWVSVDMFLRCGTQWRTSVSGVTGLDYAAVVEVIKLYKVDDPTSGEDAGTREYLTIQYERVVPLLVEAIKELSTSNNALQARIAALEAAG